MNILTIFIDSITVCGCVRVNVRVCSIMPDLMVATGIVYCLNVNSVLITKYFFGTKVIAVVRFTATGRTIK